MFQEREFLSRQDLDQYADQNWDQIQSIWNKKLLLCYSDMMNGLYKLNENSEWGPMDNQEKWQQREYELRVNYYYIFSVPTRLDGKSCLLVRSS
ncbi:hypothetical protein F8M41_012810 [Gigaspora margarita]|uniref:Uncharacterized protein n=1 Tax=Gigaspora margarita TaxID=4874 RepID=A0A8H4B3W9_GIGMA|nr:hypothetical protein F8M41_012810 [Gigaspora margarita]